jgi:subtilisin family serine protease
MPDWLERLTQNSRWLWLSALLGILLLALAGGGWWAIRTDNLPAWVVGAPTPISTPWAATPPATLAAIPDLPTLQALYPALAEILADPAIASAYKDFLVAYQSGGLAAARTLAEKRGLIDVRNRLSFTLVLDDPAYLTETLKQLEPLPVTVTGALDDEINLQLSWGAIELVSSQNSGVTQLFEQLRQLEHVARLKLPITARRQSSLPAGSILSEGINASGAPAWHQAGFTGQGIKIAVLDLGFAGYQDLLGTELPANVTTVAFGSPTDTIDPDLDEPHGTACAEIIHDMAPDAELSLLYFDGSDLAFKQAVRYIQQNEIQIVSYSVGSSYGPHDGSGESAQLVDELASNNILWVNATGNEAYSHYRDTFTDTDGDGIHEFPDGEELLAVLANTKMQEVLLQWDDWQRADQDYDLYLYDDNGDLLASSTETQDGSRFSEPVEYLKWRTRLAQTVYVQVRSDRAKTANVIEIYAHNGDLAYFTAEQSLTSPADARGAFSVGAVEWWDEELAGYSSQGPTTDGRLKPEISAATSVSTESYGDGEFNGTSAATPHVAGAAALVWTRFPSFNRGAVITFLQDHAKDLGRRGADSQTGYGWLQLPNLDTAATEPSAAETAEQPIFDAPTVEVTPQASPSPVQWPTLPPKWQPPAPPSAPVDDNAGVLMLVGLCGLACCGGSLLLFVPIVLLLKLRGKKSTTASPIQPVAAEPAESDEPAAVKPAARPVANAATPAAHLRTSQGETIVLKPGSIIGRSPQNQIVLTNLLVSREHARFEIRAGHWWLCDLNSANGTWVNRQRIQEHQLQNGDVIEIQTLTFKFELDH